MGRHKIIKKLSDYKIDKKTLEREKKIALKKAKELCYDSQCMDDIKKSVNDHEITRALISARYRQVD